MDSVIDDMDDSYDKTLRGYHKCVSSKPFITTKECRHFPFCTVIATTTYEMNPLTKLWGTQNPPHTHRLRLYLHPSCVERHQQAFCFWSPSRGSFVCTHRTLPGPGYFCCQATFPIWSFHSKYILFFGSMVLRSLAVPQLRTWITIP